MIRTETEIYQDGTETVTVNREYKDRLFTFIFGSEENRKWTLSLYNAVNGSDYTDETKIQITTIKTVLYLGMHNDVAFLISDDMNLYEQQSTFNPNMPLRKLQYISSLYEKYLTANSYNKFRSRLIPLPVPKLVTFYNGTNDREDETVLRLSDSFPEGKTGDIEVLVRMISINYGHSPGVLDACEPLKEYSWIISEIRRNEKSMDILEAVDKAIEDMPEGFPIKDFLIQHKAEVREMLTTEYNEIKQMQMFREDGREEGREEGRVNTVSS